MRVVAIAQARMSSSRLPGKVLLRAAGRALLDLHLDRLTAARLITQVVVATSDHPSDNPIALHCTNRGILCVRGPLDDVLERYRLAAEATNADVVVRTTADCPLLDPLIVDGVVALRNGMDLDYAANLHPATFPLGMSAECCSRAALLRCAHEATLAPEREHVTWRMRQRPDLYRSAHMVRGIDRSAVRLTVDFPSDLSLIDTMLRHGAMGGLDDILAVYDAHPAWGLINANNVQHRPQ